MRTIESRMENKEFVDSLPKTRAEAKAANRNIYYTGICKHGHDSYRYTANSACCKCQSLISLRSIKKTAPETLAGYRKIANSNWNNGDKGKSAKVRWQERNPKWAWAVNVLGGARERVRSSSKDIPYNVTNEYLYSILPDLCPIFGTPFIYTGNKKTGPHSPTIDRVDPNLGYVIGNIAVISMKANLIKSNANAEEIQKVANWLKIQENKIS